MRQCGDVGRASDQDDGLLTRTVLQAAVDKRFKQTPYRKFPRISMSV